MPKVDKILMVFLVLIVGIMIGYGWRLHHERQIIERYNTQAERDLGSLENEFHESWEKKYSFNIFNGQFRVWPIKNDKQEKRFSYAGAGDTTRQEEK